MFFEEHWATEYTFSLGFFNSLAIGNSLITLPIEKARTVFETRKIFRQSQRLPKIILKRFERRKFLDNSGAALGSDCKVEDVASGQNLF